MRIIKQGKMPMPRGVCKFCGTEIEASLSECHVKPSMESLNFYHACPLCGSAIAMNASPEPLNSPTTHQNDDPATTLP